MERAGNVFFGVILIITLWLWMGSSIKPEDQTWWMFVVAISKVICACYMTAPIYREYLK